MNEKKKCPQCGIEFAPARWWQEFCCVKHRQDFHNNKYRSAGAGPYAPHNERNLSNGHVSRAVGKKLSLADLGLGAPPMKAARRERGARMTDYDFKNNATRKEREELLHESMLPTTYHRLAGLDDQLGGRFRVKESVAGEEKATDYPKQPEGSPWSAQADVGVEPPTGEEIAAMSPTGEFFEVQRSIAEQELGEPAGASTHPACQNQELRVALEAGSPPDLEVDPGVPSTCPAKRPAGTGVLSTSIPSTKSADLAENRRSSGSPAAAVVPGLAVSSPASPERGPRPSSSSPDDVDPPDGLEGLERRSDGTPLSGFIRRKIT